MTQSKHIVQSWETDSTLRYKEIGWWNLVVIPNKDILLPQELVSLIFTGMTVLWPKDSAWNPW